MIYTKSAGVIILTVQVMDSSFAFTGTPRRLAGYFSGTVNEIGQMINSSIV